MSPEPHPAPCKPLIRLARLSILASEQLLEFEHHGDPKEAENCDDYPEEHEGSEQIENRSAKFAEISAVELAELLVAFQVLLLGLRQRSQFEESVLEQSNTNDAVPDEQFGCEEFLQEGLNCLDEHQRIWHIPFNNFS